MLNVGIQFVLKILQKELSDDAIHPQNHDKGKGQRSSRKVRGHIRKGDQNLLDTPGGPAINGITDECTE